MKLNTISFSSFRQVFLGFLVAFCGVGSVSWADEGMWLLNKFPTEKVKKAYGYDVKSEWLSHVQQSSVRLGGGCSGSFVSEQGLVMTNHHCAHACIEQLSTVSKDFIQEGFFAKSTVEEVKCPEIEISRLVEIKDVTAQVQKATKGLKGPEFQAAQKAKFAEIEKACSQALVGHESEVRCDVVNLYQGGAYHLYKYERYQDVRLVFAPEFKIAFFGGDPDNFMFPRYDMDISFLRVYKNNAPIKSDHFFSWAKTPLKEGDLTFVTGHPGRTGRLLTVADLAFLREVRLPDGLMLMSELRGLLMEYQARGPDQLRKSHDVFFGIENSLKAYKGRFLTLNDPKINAKKKIDEERLRKKMPEAFKEIEKINQTYRNIYVPYRYLEVFDGESRLLDISKNLARAFSELSKPNSKRLKEFTESQLPQLKQGLFSTAPIHLDLEETFLRYYFAKLREMLSPEHAVIKKLFSEKSPAELAHFLVMNTKIQDVEFRQKIWDLAEKAKDNAAMGTAVMPIPKDEMLEVAKIIEPFALAIRERFENEVDGPFKVQREKLAKLRFSEFGDQIYPDATSSLRLSYGKVAGYQEGEHKVAPFTQIAGAFDRHTGYEPFALPSSWLNAKEKLNLRTPLNFVSTNDIIGGNSGSPVINRYAEIVGLIFDGNIQSLGGDYVFEPDQNRAVSVSGEALLELLNKVYHADRLLQELKFK